MPKTHSPTLLVLAFGAVGSAALPAMEIPRGTGRLAAAPAAAAPAPARETSRSLTATSTAKVDLSANFPAPFDQGVIGSCVASALGYGLHTYQLRIAVPTFPLTTSAGQFSPSFLYNQYTNGRDIGSDPVGIADIMGRRGCATLVQFPYTTTLSKWPTPAVATQALPYRLQRLAGTNAAWPYYKLVPKTSLATIKATLLAGKPMGIGIYADTAFMQLGAKTNYVWYPSGNIYGGHELVIIGFDDAKTDGAGHVGALKFQNSWGLNWGQSGRGWISYDALATSKVIDLGVMGETKPVLTPNITANLKISHPRRGSLQVIVGVGSTATPLWYDRFYTVSNGTPQSGGLDTELYLTEAAPYWPPTTARPWWILVTDAFKDAGLGSVSATTITNARSGQMVNPSIRLPASVPDLGTSVVPFTTPVKAVKGSG